MDDFATWLKDVQAVAIETLGPGDLVVLTSFFAIALVALSRIYLGVHFLSDVLAAFAESTAWLALTLTAVHTLRQGRAIPHSAR